MRTLLRCLSVAVATLALLAPAIAAQTPSIEGTWEGPMKLPSGLSLRIRINIAKSAAGTLSATMESPDQGPGKVPVDEVVFANGVLKWSIARLRASFEGKLNASGEIVGKLTQGIALDLTLKRVTPASATASESRRPQTPQPPFPYKSEDLTFPSKQQGVTLAGTLTLPQGAGPFPAVVLISGSGPQNRDEDILGHSPFLVLSDYLTRRGVAVLRYDDRGIGKSTGTYTAATSLDFSDDAEGALDFLKTRKEIDAKRIGFAGHSEGGMIAPMIAARRPDVAFIVLMAGSAVPGSAVIDAQIAALNRIMGTPEATAKANAEIQSNIYTAIRTISDPIQLNSKLNEILALMPEAQRAAQVRMASSPWFRYFVTYDPAPTLEKVKCPVLAINGELDLQVLPDQNLPVIEAALKKGGNVRAAVVRLPGLNHLFQTAKTGMPTEYGQIEETMSPKALDTVSSWVREVTGLASR